LYYRLEEYFLPFLEHSEKEFDGRFDRILLNGQREEEKQILEESENVKRKEKMRAAQRQEQKQLAAVLAKNMPAKEAERTFCTSFVEDVFGFMDDQLERISKDLDQ